jgi:hypothetical protein
MDVIDADGATSVAEVLGVGLGMAEACVDGVGVWVTLGVDATIDVVGLKNHQAATPTTNMIATAATSHLM